MDNHHQNDNRKATEKMDEEIRQKLVKDRPELDPYEINFLPRFKSGSKPKKPFLNPYGVVIGDHEYESPQSPLEQWSEDTDPAVMAGDDWVHPYKDIGFQTAENRKYFEQGIAPESGIFTHPDKDVAYEVEQSGRADEEPLDE